MAKKKKTTFVTDVKANQKSTFVMFGKLETQFGGFIFIFCGEHGLVQEDIYFYNNSECDGAGLKCPVAL